MPDSNPNQTISGVLEALEAALKSGDTAAAVALFQPDGYLARSRRVHLEHQDDGGPRADRRDARRAT